MMKRILLLFFLLSVKVMCSQTAYVVLSNSKYTVPDKYFTCGDALKLRMKSGRVEKGIIDTIFADGLVLSGDTVMFSAVHKFSYKYQNRKAAKVRFVVSLGATVAGMLLITASVLRTNAHEADPNAIADLDIAVGSVLFLVGVPFLADAIVKEYVWRGHYIGPYWNLHGTML